MTIELRQTAAIRVARGPIVLDTPVVTPTAIFTGESSQFVVRLDKRTHKQAWKKKQMARVRSAHGDNILVYAGQTGETQLWDGDGKVLWKHRGSEIAFADRLHFDADGRLQIVDVHSGKIVDEFECPPGRTHRVHDGILLRTNAKGPTDPVQAVDLAARTLRWEQNLIPAIQARFGDPCPRGLSFQASRPGHVVAKSGAHLVAVSLTDGSLGWGLPISLPYRAPLVKAGRMYVWSAPAGWTSVRISIDIDSGEVTRETTQPDSTDNHFVIVGRSQRRNCSRPCIISGWLDLQPHPGSVRRNDLPESHLVHDGRRPDGAVPDYRWRDRLAA